eukprot:Ihof_evm7s454 gene=Ihof_evmTU7s454
MLFKIAVIASLLMLGEGAIEMPLNKVTNLPRPSHHLHSIYNPNSYSQHEDMELEGGLSSVHYPYIADVMIGDKNYKLIANAGSSDLLVGDNCVTYERQATCDPQTALVGHYIEGSEFAKSQSRTYTGKEDDNKIPNALAMCFDPSDNGGKMIIGGGEIENTEFSPLVLKSWYTVTLDSMSINGRLLRSAA